MLHWHITGHAPLPSIAVQYVRLTCNPAEADKAFKAINTSVYRCEDPRCGPIGE